MPKPKAKADNTNQPLNNSSHPTRTEFNNCVIIYLYFKTFSLKKPFVFATELHYIWRKHANLSSVKQLKPKTWRIFDEFDVILHHIHANG